MDRPGEFANQPSIALDSSGYAYISYYDDTSGDLIFASRDGGGIWSYEAVDTTGTVGEWSSLTFDSGDNPVVSYCDRTNGELKLAKRSSLVAIQPLASATGVHLRAPAPNPRRGSQAVTLEFATPRDQLLSFALLDVSGRLLESREAAYYRAGGHRVTWNIGRQAPGVYFVRMWTDSGQRVNQKLVVVP